VRVLADTSAWAWSRKSSYEQLRREFDERLVDGELAICDVVELELLYSTRTGAEFVERRRQLDLLDRCPIDTPEWRRALDVMQELALAGGLHHRAVKWADLLVAAAAESAGLPILHYDEDYERISAITGQLTQWLAPRGSLS
jgi:predicted nucleic acid-binding protein